MARFILLVLAVTLLPIQAYACEKLSDLTWLLGSWINNDSKKLITETWVKQGEFKISGLGVSLLKNNLIKKPPFFEFLSIEVIGNEMFYIAKPPQNELPTAFKALACSSDEARFENSSHDFPKKIIYRKISDGGVKVDVLGTDDKGFSLNYTKLENQASNTKRLVSEYVDAFNQKSLDKMLYLVDDNIAWFSVNSDGQKIETANKEELTGSMKGYFKSSFSTRSQLLNVKVWGDFLLATEKASWEQEGKTKSQCSNVAYQIDAEKIKRVWYYPAKKCSESLL